jgi:hypothetical protein
VLADVEACDDVVEHAPVGGAEVRDVGGVHHARSIGMGDVRVFEQRQDVAHVLLGAAMDLQLGQQEVGERDREVVEVEPVLERHIVVHAQGVEEHIDVVVVVDGTSGLGMDVAAGAHVLPLAIVCGKADLRVLMEAERAHWRNLWPGYAMVTDYSMKALPAMTSRRSANSSRNFARQEAGPGRSAGSSTISF